MFPDFDHINLYNWLFPKIQNFCSDISKIKSLSQNFKKDDYIFYFGDSVIERISKFDKDQRTIDQLLEAKQKNSYKIACLSHSAYHMGIYYPLISVLVKNKYIPKYLIVPINMRSFSPQWFFEPSWQFDYEIKLINKFLDNPNSRVFRYFPKKMRGSYNKYLNINIDYPLVPFKKIKEFVEWEHKFPIDNDEFNYRKKVIFIFHYLYKLNGSHIRLNQLINICDIVSNTDIKIILYVTPINFRAGIKFVGCEFLNYFNDNLKIISNAMARFEYCENIKFIDLSTRFSPNLFFHDDLATEHLNENGRNMLVNILSEELPKL